MCEESSVVVIYESDVWADHRACVCLDRLSSSSSTAAALTGRAVTLGRGLRAGERRLPQLDRLPPSTRTTAACGPAHIHTFRQHRQSELLHLPWGITRRLRAMEAPACRAAKFACSPLPHFSSLQRGRHVSPTWDTHTLTYTHTHTHTNTHTMHV